MVRENKWRAARRGLEADIITEDGRVRPVREAICELVQELRPTAERLGCQASSTGSPGCWRSARPTSGSARSRRPADGDLTAVVDSLLAEFAADRPGAESPPGPRSGG